MLFTLPDKIAMDLRDFVPAGRRSGFVVKYIALPLEKLQHKKKKPAAEEKLKAAFLGELKKIEKRADKGKKYSQEEIMKEFGLI